MRRPLDRRRFLRRCGVAGLGLALSTSGGRSGERRLPLLVTSDDWAALRVRMLEILPELSFYAQRQLLSSLLAAISDPSLQQHREAATAAALEFLPAVQEEWDTQGKPVPTLELEAFYALSVEVRPLRAGPQLEPTLRDALAAFGAPLSEINLRVQTETLSLIALVLRNEPRALRQAGWPAAYRDRTVELVEAARQASRHASDVVSALESDDEEWMLDYDDVAAEGHEAQLWRQASEALLEADVEAPDLLEIVTELSDANASLNRWVESADEEAAERAVREREEDEEEDPDEDAVTPFSIEAVLADL
jgi:hypothetical protein